jgi:hypothetical protein
MTYTGLLLRESLLDDGILATLTVTKTEVWRDIPGRAAFQPADWTGIWFSGDAAEAEAVAQRLSAALDPRWYCNLMTQEHTRVIYGGRVFCYPRGDAAGRAAAQAHGRAMGIPERQLDWGEAYP